MAESWWEPALANRFYRRGLQTSKTSIELSKIIRNINIGADVGGGSAY
jgi:hypothetical protein